MKNEAIKIEDNLYYDERSAGGIVYRMENGKVKWLLIRTISGYKSGKKKNPKPVYKFPKGHLKDNEFLKQAALREVEEEGRIKEIICCFSESIRATGRAFQDLLTLSKK